MAILTNKSKSKGVSIIFLISASISGLKLTREHKIQRYSSGKDFIFCSGVRLNTLDPLDYSFSCFSIQGFRNFFYSLYILFNQFP